MPMNSFSFLGPAGLEDLGTTQLIDLHPEGEVFNSTKLNLLKNIDQKPVELKLLPKDWSDTSVGRRAAPRYKLNFHVLICNHKKSFRTHSENVSMTGVLLADEIPKEFADGPFDIILIQERDPAFKKHILFRGGLVLDQKDHRRIFFKEMAEDSISTLYSLIDKYIVKPAAK